MNKMTFPERLKACRKSAKLSQKDLSKKVGLHQTMISKIERGKHSTTVYILKIADALNVDPHWLEFGEKKAFKNDEENFNVELMSDLIAQTLLSLRDSMHLVDPKYIGYKVVQIYLDNVEKGIDVSQARAVIDFIFRHQEDVPRTSKNQSEEKDQKQHAVLRNTK